MMKTDILALGENMIGLDRAILFPRTLTNASSSPPSLARKSR